MSNLEEILIAGESYKVEFKETVDKTLVEEVVAFANATGGKIFIGVRDDGSIKGTDTSNVARSRIQDTLSQIQPHIDFELEIEKNVIILNINEGKNKPFACSRGFFIRMGANSQKLERDEIIEFFQSEGRYIFDQYINRKVEADKWVDDLIYEEYLKKANISNILPKLETLTNLNCVVEENDKLFINNTGILFFSKHPTKIINHAYVVCALFKGLDKEYILDRKEFTGDIITNIEDSILFLKKHLNLRYEIKSIRRKEILDIPETALREVVINAICHRDYFEKGAQVMVEIYDDRVVITNPGGIPKGMDSKKFGKISIARNPNIASLLQRANYIEKMGTGIARITNAMKKVGLPEPKFELDDFFMVTLLRESFIKRKNHTDDTHNETDDTDNDADDTDNDADDTDNDADDTDNDADDTDNDTVDTDNEIDDNNIESKIMKLIEINDKISIAEMVDKTQKSRSTIQRGIKILRDNGVIERIGNSKSGFWKIVKIGGVDR